MLLQTNKAVVVEDETQENKEDNVGESLGANHLQGDDRWWFEPLETALHRERNRGSIGAHISQIKYLVKQFRLEGIAMPHRAKALEALVIANEDEVTDERRDWADAFTACWGERIHAFWGQH